MSIFARTEAPTRHAHPDLPAGYELLVQSMCGWWVAGNGYLVSGYCDTKDEAVDIAVNLIRSVERLDQWPIWRVREV